ncbi:MAG: cobyric acid synthase [Oscillospiraceae bacterium]
MGKAVMIQGTMSDSGKSLITAGLCKAFSNRGYSVAPFKSQNMALNCYYTKEGLQMGTAQAVQAEAAGIPPDISMNPILLKPTSDVGSEIIVMGKSCGFMKAREYFDFRRSLIPVIEKAYKKLLKENDLVIIEGAGSPAEINLKKDDIVNMGMAKIAEAPVLLVGDIDRGGVFASLYGTYMLLEKEEQNYIKGIIINKFRGDKSLLTSGIDMFKKRLPVDILGVMPYLDINIDQEDSLSKKDIIGKSAVLNIGVVDMPHMLNFSDLLILKKYDFLNLKYIKNFEALESMDMVIIPDFDKSSVDFKSKAFDGLKSSLEGLCAAKIPVIAINSGFEILGSSFFKKADTIEKGMKIFDWQFTNGSSEAPLSKSAVIQNIDGYFDFLNGTDVTGFFYNRHEFYFKGFNNILLSAMGGIFNNDDLVHKIIEHLLAEKGISSSSVLISSKSYRDSQFDLLGKSIENNLDVKAILKIIERGV